jgi:hypothetical protein
MSNPGSLIEMGKLYGKLFATDNGRFALKEIAHGESRIGRAKTVVEVYQNLSQATTSILPLRDGLSWVDDLSEFHDGRSEKSQPDILELLAYMPSDELKTIASASVRATELYDQLRKQDPIMEEYLRIIAGYAVNTYNNPDSPDSRIKFISSLDRFRGKNYEFVQKMRGELSPQYQELLKSVGIVLSPWLKRRVDMHGDHLPLSQNFEEWTALQEFPGSKASEVVFKSLPKDEIPGTITEINDLQPLVYTPNLDSLGNSTQKQVANMLTKNYRRIASVSELSTLSPYYFDNEASQRFAKEWWDKNESNHSGIRREGTGSQYLINSVMDEVAERLSDGQTWTLQDVYNYTEVLGPDHVGSPLSNHLLSKFAESVAIPLAEVIENDSTYSAREAVLKVLLSRLKASGNDRWYKHWHAITKLSDY